MSAPVEMMPWSRPDAHGIRTSTDRRRTRRLRRAEKKNSLTIGAWPAEWRELAVAWLRAGGASVLSKSLFKAAGNLRHLAYDVMDALLEAGWIELEDQFGRGAWIPHRLTWIDADELRGLLGLRRVDSEKAARDSALAAAPADERLLPLHLSLATRSTRVVLSRSELIQKLDEWLAAERSGTRQQFAHFARGDTKGIPTSEWAWLSEHADMEALGVSRHTPALYIRAPLSLVFDHGRLDLSVVPDVIGLSPGTINAIRSIEGPACRWLLVENRTSFEDVARRAGDRDAVVWLPGFATNWWLDAMAAFIALHGGRAFIAADPDPAGIDIAMRAGALWIDDWEPWAMSVAALESIADTKPLNAYDTERLASQYPPDLPAQLGELVTHMIASGTKGEQEALDLLAWLEPSLAQ